MYMSIDNKKKVNNLHDKSQQSIEQKGDGDIPAYMVV